MDGWQQGEQYERYMGRWSRPTAVKFLRWLAVQDGQKWLDVGCGTGALSTEIVNHVAPASVAGIDASSGFIDEARRRLPPGIDLRVGDAQSLPFASGSFDVVVSGIALNFVPDAQLAVREMRRVARTGGAVGVYLWDYNDGMEMIRVFWDVAVALDNQAAPRDEATRFPLCREDRLGQLFDSFTWNALRLLGTHCGLHPSKPTPFSTTSMTSGNRSLAAKVPLPVMSQVWRRIIGPNSATHSTPNSPTPQTVQYVCSRGRGPWPELFDRSRGRAATCQE